MQQHVEIKLQGQIMMMMTMTFDRFETLFSQRNWKILRANLQG